MPAPILAAVDPVTVDLAPVRFGAALAARVGAPLSVVAVHASDDLVERLAGGLQGEELPRDPAPALDRATVALAPLGVSADTVAVGAGSVPRGLILTAEELGAGLVVVGSAAAAEPGRTAPGGIGARLLNGGTCATAIVPRDWDDTGTFATIGAGFVATAEGRAALDGAHALAERAAVQLRVLAVVRPRSWMGAAGDDPDRIADDLRVRAEDAVGASTGDLVGERLDLDVAVGEPADVLLGASSELDLLVCGARGYGPRPATLLGGVTRAVAAGASCPVIVLCRGADVPLEAVAG